MSEQTKRAISYTLSFTEPQAHYVEVTLSLRGFSSDFIDLKMPVWTPGSYLVREFARHVESFSAQENNGEVIQQEKISKNTWRVYHQQKDTIVRYRVYGFETSVRTNFIDDTHAFISPAGTFLYVDGHLDLPCTVQVELSSQNIGLALDVGKADNEKLKLHQMIATTDLCSTFPRNLP